MQKTEMTLVYYHVPEDKDDPKEPNIFHIPVAQNKLRLAHIHQHFPLKGQYTFRFKFSHEGLIVWLDLNDPQTALPTFNNQIHIKASRLSWTDSKVAHPTTNPVSNTASNSHKKGNVNLFDHNEESVAEGKAPPKSPVDFSLLDSHHGHLDASPTLSEPSSKVDFFEADISAPKAPHKIFSMSSEHTGDLI
jgi:hypothetical protein